METSKYYKALCSHDRRFDGRFFVGVRTTGIYCRPVCRVRTPKEENCIFFETAAEAEKAGFRPCLKCRPELAPGDSLLESSSDLAKTVAKEIEASCGIDESLSELASRLGCSDRHLRRVFEEEFHVTPLQYRQTCRLLLAKSLLTDTGLSVTDVAMASGFGSLRRFNTVFEREYKLTPSAMRKQAAGGYRRKDSFTVEIGYRPPYRWEEILAFLRPRAIPGVESIDDGVYRRTVGIKDRAGYIEVRKSERSETLAVTVSSSLLPVLPRVLARTRSLFDTDSDPDAIADGLGSMKDIDGKLPIPGLRVPGCFDPFEIAVRAIVGQQITVRAATTLAGRLAAEYGTPVETGIDGLDTVFPSAETLLEKASTDRLGELGIIAARSAAIMSAAELFASGRSVTREQLLDIKGIGPWTAGYIQMRAFGDTDVFLETDYAVKKALAPMSRKEMLELAEDWRPWRSYAVMELWNI